MSPYKYFVSYTSFYLVHAQFPQIGAITKKDLPRLRITHHDNMVAKLQMYEETIKSHRHNSAVKVKYICITNNV